LETPLETWRDANSRAAPLYHSSATNLIRHELKAIMADDPENKWRPKQAAMGNKT
jgi:hypothetical protein